MKTNQMAKAPDYHKLPIDILLSGGGYRATAFHLGFLRFLFEHSWRPDGPAALTNVRRIIGISGGSITAAHLAYRFNHYVANFASACTPLKQLLTSSDVRRAILIDNKEFAEQVTPLLPEEARFSQLPDLPELYILGTNYKSGGVLSFSNTGLRHYRESHASDGPVNDKLILDKQDFDMFLKYAVSASAAFPPFLPPLTISENIFRVKPPPAKLDPLLATPLGIL